jgi:hypothetical protein
VGLGVSGTGDICPPTGRAGGLSAGRIVQSDEFSGGTTQTEVPTLTAASPVAGELVYGPLVALAQTSGRARIAVSITRAGARRPAFRAGNVNTAQGVLVRSLRLGVYNVKWVITGANGDTRTVSTRFIELGRT